MIVCRKHAGRRGMRLPPRAPACVPHAGLQLTPGFLDFVPRLPVLLGIGFQPSDQAAEAQVEGQKGHGQENSGDDNGPKDEPALVGYRSDTSWARRIFATVSPAWSLSREQT